MNNTDKKARQCVVVPSGRDRYEVQSSSGNTYIVTLTDNGAFARCTCPWGDIHMSAGTETGCSHMRAVWLYEQGHPFVLAEQAQAELDEELARHDAEMSEAAFFAGEAYRDALDAGYSDAEAAAAADSMIGYFGDEHE